MVSGLVSGGSTPIFDVGIVNYDGRTASIAFGNSVVDGISARVIGSRSRQLLQLTLGWVTDADAVCCPVRSYIQRAGWESQGHGRPGRYGVVFDTRSWLGVSVSVEPSNTSTHTIPKNPTVLSVVPGSPAFGLLEPGDSLLGVEGVSPSKHALEGSPVIDQIASQQPGTRIALSIERGGSEMVVDLTLSSYASKAYEAYADNSTGFPDLGVEAADLTQQLRQKEGIVAKSGAVIIGVMSGSPAADAGMAIGDVIVLVDSHQITDTHDLSDPIGGSYLSQPGLNWTIHYESPNGQQHLANVTTSSPQGGWEYPLEVTAL